ncbi:LysR family transcriptional regulator [Paenibacillus hemerocallicola]|uniref:LysR family transcriptional regulator n=1 Tax=Paenibacillus hemerocallicola TaxID=1172614 RepID=A0A5C4T0M4_9BACL|nr:LysR family transcriptional regulator [Paenibacillus hemerocallicola]TNJ62632.1 LysR family transcriptional regulator [Paenibacillus hemerocallicola]
MNIDQLAYIVEVARVKSLSAASLNLHVTQSAISQAITGLEKELGIKLFVRSRAETVPTPEGRAILKKAQEVTRLIREIREEAENRAGTLRGRLRLGTLPAEMIALVQVVASLKQDHPHVHIEMSEKGSVDVMDDVRSGELDLGLVAMPEDQPLLLKDLKFERLYKGKLMIAAGRRSPLAARKSVTPQELREQLLVLYKDDYVEWFIRDFTAQFGPPSVLFKTNNAGAIQSALLEGIAVTVGHDFSFLQHSHHVNADYALLELDRFIQQPVHFGWVWPAKQLLSPVAKYVMERFKHETRAYM